MKKLVFLFFALSSFTLLFSQHLPLKIGNQWHYDVTGFSSGPNYGAVAADTINIDNKKYFRIEHRHYLTGELLSFTYDRIDGDSCYYRRINNQDSLLINFSWQTGYTQIIPIDSNCIELRVYSRGNWNLWGINTDFFDITFGFWCAGDPDTTWALTSYNITKYFGCRLGSDGWLQGAKVNDTTYGTLYPLPVELLSFSSSVNDNDVTLNWTTATETNNSGFEIQKSPSPTPSLKEGALDHWEIIGFLDGHGTTTELQTYSYQNENLSAGKYQYRLKQIDFDGTFEYSNTIEVEIIPPTKFSLEQNYPNPFNPSTNIRFTIPYVETHLDASLLTTLKVFDVLGNEVATLVNEEKSSGTYQVEFDALRLASGLYFYQLKYSGLTQTKKMILIK